MNQNMNQNSNQRTYRKVKNLVENAAKNVVSTRKLAEKPYTIDDYGDTIYIHEQVMLTMDDGIEIEGCLWGEADMCLYDFSIEKKMFDESGKGDFLNYLESKGFFLENIEESSGTRWRYCEQIEQNDVYRIQYYRVGKE